MWDIKDQTKHNNTYNGNFSSFNRIKRGSFVRSDDAIETIKCHIDYEVGTTHGRSEESCA